MDATWKWALQKWQEVIKNKLTGSGVSNKANQNLVKKHREDFAKSNIPPLNKPDWTIAAKNVSQNVQGKRRANDPEGATPRIHQTCQESLDTITIDGGKKIRRLQGLNTKKGNRAW